MTDRVLPDTNALLDVMLEVRGPQGFAVGLYERMLRGATLGFLFPDSLTDIEHIARKDLALAERRAWTRESLSNMSLAPFDRKVCERAVELDERDYEDALVHAAAELAGCTHVIARDAKAYLGIAPMEKMDPEGYMRLVL